MEGEYYICHHGIKGQRWGIRRYQNEDGSYTAAGKKRYIADKMAKVNSDNSARKAKVEQKLSRKWDLNVAKQNMENRRTISEKIFFNDATFKKAAKYVVDNKMSYNDAVKKAKEKAVINTVGILGAIGAVSVASTAAITRTYAKNYLWSN